MSLCVPLSAIIFDTMIPYLLSRAIGTIENGQEGMSTLLITAGIVGLIGITLNLIGYQVAARHESNIRVWLIDDVMSRLLNKDMAFFSNQKVGALTSGLVDFVDNHINLQSLILMKTIPFVLNTSLGILLIAQASMTIALIVLGLVVALLVQVRLSSSYREDYRMKRKKLRGETHGLIADIFANNQTVKTFAMESNELATISDINNRFRHAYVRDFSVLSIDGTLRLLVMNSIQIFSIILIAGMLASGNISLGIAIFTLAYLQRFATQLFELGAILLGYDTLFIAAAPMTEILLKEPVVKDADNATVLKINGGSVEFSSVSFSYEEDKSSSALIDFNLVVPSGQRLGIVGRSGAGKTTLTKLLLRFNDISQGSISIDNQDVALVTQRSLRQAISYVPQEPLLFHRSIRDNIAYGDWSATNEEVAHAAKLAHATEFIEKLPLGMDTIVGERGVKLSGGQRQRIAIARAILKDAPILVLDEATSALDSESEKLIQSALKKLMKGRTSIVIAHRLSTIAQLDRIIVLDDGRVVEDGTHEELLKNNGTYAKLWSHQSGGFIEE